MSDYINVIVSFNGNEISRASFSKPDVTIGRGSDADIFLDNPGVSREHARISNSGSGLVVTDLKSNNGTFINGQSVDVSALNPGDTLRISKFSLMVEKSDAPISAGTSAPSGDTAGSDAPSDERPSKPSDRAAEAIGVDHTVVVNPREKQQILRQPATAKPAPAAEKSSTAGFLGTFIAGALVGALVTWFLLK